MATIIKVKDGDEAWVWLDENQGVFLDFPYLNQELVIGIMDREGTLDASASFENLIKEYCSMYLEEEDKQKIREQLIRIANEI